MELNKVWYICVLFSTVLKKVPGDFEETDLHPPHFIIIVPDHKQIHFQ